MTDKFDHLERSYRRYFKDIGRRCAWGRPPYPPDHLVSLSRVIHVVAGRVMRDKPNPARDASKCGDEDAQFRYGILAFRFRDYLHAVKNLNDAVEKAAVATDENEKLTLRDYRSGLPLDTWQAPIYETVGKWERALLGRDDALALKTLLGGVHMEFHFRDNVVVALDEIDAWALTKGITSLGELRALLDENWAQFQRLGRDPAETDSTPATEPSNATTASADERDDQPKESLEERNARIVARCIELKMARVKNWQRTVASEFGLHVSTIKKIYRRCGEQNRGPAADPNSVFGLSGRQHVAK